MLFQVSHDVFRYDCLRTCKGTKGCNWFTFLPSSKVCILLSDCSSLDESCEDECLSGEARCEEEFDPGWCSRLIN